MNFVAIDFETANEKRNSPCSIGIVVVKNNKVVEKKNILIKPFDMRFSPLNIWIHGIKPEMVVNEKEFNVVWEEIKHYFNETMIIAHNASFDISVLRHTLEHYHIELPCFNYICTMKLSKNFYTNLENCKLNTVNKLLNYSFNHHYALDDALACSNIMLNISNELQINDINDIAITLGISIGELSSTSYYPCKTKSKAHITSFRKLIESNFKVSKNSSSLLGQTVVFTGGLKSMSRGEAMSRVRKVGGYTSSTVTKKTTYLIVAIKDYSNLHKSEMSTKLRKATMLKEQGQCIQIINEDDFLNLI